MFTRRTVLALLCFLGLGTVVWFAGCSRAPDPWGGKPTPHILVTVPPLYSFAKSVAGEHGDVKCLCTEEGPHHYDYSQTDLRTLRTASCFISIGLTLDDKFSDGMVEATGKHELLVKLGDKLPADLKQDFAHEPGTRDPHVWNGTPQAKKMVEMIRDELKKVDPANAADYDKNAAAYLKELDELHDYGVKELKGIDKKNRKIISFHESLGYFAKEFDIEIVKVIEDIPGNEPDRTKINDLVDDCIKKDVHVIAVEPQYPTSTAAKLLQERVKDVTKGKRELKLVEIDPLETAAEKELTADLYVKTMQKNLKALADNLK